MAGRNRKRDQAFGCAASERIGVYDGEHTTEIVFPLGGIGTGSIGLAGNGRLVEFEIANRPNKRTYNGFSFFAIKAESDSTVRMARVLHGDLLGSYTGDGAEHFRGFGFGPPRESLGGLPHFHQWRFEGRFPVAQLEFHDPDRWVDARLTAFNPFIPHNSHDSSLPAALFSWTATNVSEQPLKVTLAGILQNPFPENGVNRVVRRPGATSLWLGPGHLTAKDAGFGELVLDAVGSQVNAQAYWHRGGWFESLERFWSEFSQSGDLPARHYDGPRGSSGLYSAGDVGVLAPQGVVAPGATVRVRFILAWYFPHFVNYWNPGTDPCPRWLNYYATAFGGALDVAQYIDEAWPRLEADTFRFRDALFATTAPDAVLDRVSAALSVLKSPTVVRLTDGTLYGFEGCHADAGCCEGSCSHVWNYDQATPFLFPDLARSMREAAFQFGLQDAGRMAFRLLLPLERTRTESTFRAAVDGQMGEVVKVYREWKISGNTEWLRRLWPEVKQAIEYAWHPGNTDGWDRDHDGVLEGVQHHTLDVELYGPSAYLTGFYHAALAAAAEMAAALGEDSREYRELLDRGRNWVDAHLFNGEYFVQALNLSDSRYPIDSSLGEIKYQFGSACHIDQVIGQWHAHIAGLGRIFDPAKTRSALTAIHRHNFGSMRRHVNVHRLFALNDERGVVIATWPYGTVPKAPVPYHGECMTGYEYQVASHMIYEGLLAEGIEIVEAIRERYDGRRRNPWNEIECGSHYARALASFSLLWALAGFEYDMTRHYVGFNPRIMPQAFRTFWSVGEGWGDFAWTPEQLRLAVQGGRLELQSLGSHVLTQLEAVAVHVGGSAVPFTQQGGKIHFSEVVSLKRGYPLEVNFH